MQLMLTLLLILVGNQTLTRLKPVLQTLGDPTIDQALSQAESLSSALTQPTMQNLTELLTMLNPQTPQPTQEVEPLQEKLEVSQEKIESVGEIPQAPLSPICQIANQDILSRLSAYISFGE